MSWSVISVMVSGAALIVVAGCGAATLPPAGPKPGEVDVGYGTQDKSKVTGAVSSLSEDDVSTARPLPIEDLLRGRVPGLQVLRGPGGTVTYRIRGTNSLQNDRAPLFVVDGIQIPDGAERSALAGLTPDDIRQVDVLKDVASTSIYGMRGAGGVILITTRR
ncbi:MAG TPA: TonB-dependent receptor plug domain-containing protein [Longimicrobiales bacterium]|nr:TonB-dependent receptor plug domain-containing protein [Longimicrobiales bacterium]